MLNFMGRALQRAPMNALEGRRIEYGLACNGEHLELCNILPRATIFDPMDSRALVNADTSSWRYLAGCLAVKNA